MLDRSELTRIQDCFSVYDQEWRYYRGFLGEPFLVADCIVYFDGQMLYICGFPLDDPFRELSVDDIVGIAERFSKHPLGGINVWGRLPDLPPELMLSRGRAFLLQPVGPNYEEDAGEHVLDLSAFDYSRLPKARKGLRRARQAGLSAEVVTREYLSAEHIALLRRFMETHHLSTVHAGCYLSIQQLLQEPATRVIESYLDDETVGFKVLVRSGETAATAICGFYNSARVVGASDISMATCIDYCREQGVSRLHLGYSATPSLAAFKEKWGATLTGPAYKEGFYYLTDSARGTFERSMFLWRDNLFSHVLDSTARAGKL
jgi:hypothetical protein